MSRRRGEPRRRPGRVGRYATSQRVHADMLRDANRWIMTQVADAND